MYYHKFITSIFIFISALAFQSCADDFEDLSTENLTSASPLPDQANKQANLINDSGRLREVEVVTEWMDLFLVLDRYSTGMRPNATARAIAYIQLAAYESAIPQNSGFRSNTENFPDFALENNLDERRLNVPLALNKVYALTIDHFLLHLPEAKRALIDAKYEMILEKISGRQRTESVEESVEWGEYVAQQVIAFSATDQEGEGQSRIPQPLEYVPPVGQGYWTFSADQERALFPYWKSVRTFVVSTDETTTVSPLTYSEDESSAYYEQMMEVYSSNNTAKEEGNEDLWIAEFWSDDVENFVFSPPARQLSISVQLIEKERMSLIEALYLNLKVGFALNDAAVSTWKYKYEHMVMRPSVYIQKYIDQDYQTNLYRLIPWPNPTFPAYPSGHATFASAVAGVFIAFFGDDFNFTDESHRGRTEFQSRSRRFRSFTQMADENGYSRIPLGVHMRMDCSEGLRLGYEIAEGVNGYNLKQNPL